MIQPRLMGIIRVVAAGLAVDSLPVVVLMGSQTGLGELLGQLLALRVAS